MPTLSREVSDSFLMRFCCSFSMSCHGVFIFDAYRPCLVCVCTCRSVWSVPLSVPLSAPLSALSFVGSCQTRRRQSVSALFRWTQNPHGYLSVRISARAAERLCLHPLHGSSVDVVSTLRSGRPGLGVRADRRSAAAQSGGPAQGAALATGAESLPQPEGRKDQNLVPPSHKASKTRGGSTKT